ncbi:uncharacterized protein LOC128317072 isoform X2 [Pangasianodon hypophthalmus]|uniref:uncharacterized protein LOC128317072 isoform X2 n=1 Tax=Pangasianodon hypophthalmus TaxID=310915 RepID=UPI0023072044|nr:uncharacterized protein LOC128317072 isoform X2 [Pangasianodon hypophthalmus]
MEQVFFFIFFFIIINHDLKTVGGGMHTGQKKQKKTQRTKKGTAEKHVHGWARARSPSSSKASSLQKLRSLYLTLTDAGVYTSYQTVRRSKSSASVKTKREEISRVNLSVQEKPPEKRTEIPTDDAGMKCPHPPIMVLSLISCLLLQFFFA